MHVPGMIKLTRVLYDRDPSATESMDASKGTYALNRVLEDAADSIKILRAERNALKNDSHEATRLRSELEKWASGIEDQWNNHQPLAVNTRDIHLSSAAREVVEKIRKILNGSVSDKTPNQGETEND